MFVIVAFVNISKIVTILHSWSVTKLMDFYKSFANRRICSNKKADLNRA